MPHIITVMAAYPIQNIPNLTVQRSKYSKGTLHNEFLRYSKIKPSLEQDSNCDRTSLNKIIKSARRALAFKLRGHGFKSRPCAEAGLVTMYKKCGCSRWTLKRELSVPQPILDDDELTS